MCSVRRNVRVPLILIVLVTSNLGHSQEADELELPEGLSALPQLVDLVQTDHPQAAFDADVQADVFLEIEISELGEVVAANPVQLVLYTFDENDQLIENVTAPDDDEYGFVIQAVDAMLQSHFSPALDSDGQPVAVGLIYRYSFYFSYVEETVDDDVGDVETGILRGRLIERGTREPLGGVEVLASRDTEDVWDFTDADGAFEFQSLTPGTWHVEIEAAGYEYVASDEEVVSREATEVTYHIERVSYGEYTYEVRASAVRREVSRQTVTPTEIARIAGNNGDPIKVIQNLPGFARSAFNSGLIVIRGSAPEESRVFIDGVVVPLVFHFGGLTSVINADLLDELEYLPGNFSVEYGRSTGGIVNVNTRAPRADRFHGIVDIDVFDVSLLVEGPIIDDLSFFAGLRRSYIDVLLPVFIPDDAGLNLTVAPRYWDYQAKLQYDPDVNHSLALFAFGSDDALSFLLDEPPADPSLRGSIDTSTQFHRFRLSWDAELGPDLSNRLWLCAGMEDFEFFIGDEFRLMFDTRPLTLRDTLEWRPFDNFRLRPGLDIELTFFDGFVRSPVPPKEGETPVLGTTETLEARLEGATIFEPALFVEAEWDVVDPLTLIPGLRLGHYGVTDDWALDARFNARYRVADRVTLKGGVGTFHTPPTPDETDTVYGNPDLSIEMALHYSFGVELQLTDFLELDMLGFYKDQRDLVARSNELVQRNGQLVPEVYSNLGQGRGYGLEVMLRHQMANNFFGWISYTLSRSERRDNPDEEYRLFSYDQTHILALVASYELPADWTVGARFRFVTGIPQTPIIGSIYDADSDTYIRILGEPQSVRVGDFHALDVRIDKTIAFDNWVLEFYLDVSNVYNRGNPEAINYNFDFSESVPLTGLPIIPSLGIRGEF